MFDPALLHSVRDRFHHVDTCPFQGERIFFENAGGSLTLKSVVDTNTKFSSIPDNQGRDNPASHALVETITAAKQDMMLFLGATQGLVFVGESGTECLFRIIRTAILANPEHGDVVGSSLEHPATVSACKRYSRIANKRYISIAHNNQTGSVTAEDYLKHLTPRTQVATIIQTSPVTGIATDVKAIARCIRDIAPGCLVVVDGIQHAPHGDIDVNDYDVDAYTLSAYKVYSKHNYGIGWVSDRLSTLPHDRLDGTPETQWELGTRDTSAYATFSEVVNYLDWLGSHYTDSQDKRDRLNAAGKAISEQEHHLIKTMLHGADGQMGLIDMPEVSLIGGHDNPGREGLVSIFVDSIPCLELVSQLSECGIRVHVRKNDYFSGNILSPIGRETCVRVSLCHYNSAREVLYFLKSLQTIIDRYRQPAAAAS